VAVHCCCSEAQSPTQTQEKEQKPKSGKEARLKKGFFLNFEVYLGHSYH
jgi:hypothetical protein